MPENEVALCRSRHPLVFVGHMTMNYFAFRKILSDLAARFSPPPPTPQSKNDDLSPSIELSRKESTDDFYFDSRAERRNEGQQG